jgi:D-ribulokinase
VGERFPVNDPKKAPVLEPKPTVTDSNSNSASASASASGSNSGNGDVCRRQYLHGILQGIAEVERAGYKALQELGASPVREVLTAGGGSKNDMWTKMRQRMLGVPTRRADNVDAAFGCARLAAKFLSDI